MTFVNDDKNDKNRAECDKTLANLCLFGSHVSLNFHLIHTQTLLKYAELINVTFDVLY